MPITHRVEVKIGEREVAPLGIGLGEKNGESFVYVQGVLGTFSTLDEAEEAIKALNSKITIIKISKID